MRIIRIAYARRASPSRQARELTLFQNVTFDDKSTKSMILMPKFLNKKNVFFVPEAAGGGFAGFPGWEKSQDRSVCPLISRLGMPEYLCDEKN